MLDRPVRGRGRHSGRSALSIQLVIHTKRYGLVALVDRLRPDGREHGGRPRKTDRAGPQIDILVLREDRPLSGQCLLDAAADGKAPTVRGGLRDLPGCRAAEIETERAVPPGRTRLRIVERAVVRIADATGHECERAEPRTAFLTIDPLVGVAHKA